MNAFAPPPAAVTMPPAPDPFGLAAPAPASAFTPSPSPFGTVAPAPAPSASPFGSAGPVPSPFGTVPQCRAAPSPFGSAVPAPAADPFGTATAPAPPAAAHPFGVAAAPSAFGAPDPFGAPANAGPPPPATATPFGTGAPSAPAAAPAAADPWAQLHKFDSLDFAAAAAPPPPVAVPAVASPAGPAASAPTAASDALFVRLLAAAGLKPTDLGDATPAAVVEAAGRLLRQTADGLIRLLDARARIRHQFGVGAQVTTFQRAGNNPLKWTRSPEQALKQLVGTPDPGFLAGPMAVQGAFEDLQAHEVAMIAAMQEALGATVERFSPEAIKARVTAKGGLLPGSREAALWRAFEAEYKALAHESEAAYLDLFAKNFRKAYERNIKKADPV